jgi:hypothetical protein
VNVVGIVGMVGLVALELFELLVLVVLELLVCKIWFCGGGGQGLGITWGVCPGCVYMTDHA